MGFKVEYTIRAIDKFSKVADLIAKNAHKMDTAMRQAAKGSAVASRSFTKLSASAAVNNNNIEELNRAYKKIESQLDDIDKATRRVKTSNSETARSFSKLSKETKRASREAKKATADMAKVGRGLESTGRVINTRMTLPLLGFGVAAFKASKDFNAGMANVGSLIPGQGARLEELKKKTLDLSVAVGKSANEMNAGLYETISAFGDAEDPMKKLGIAARMSTAGLATVKDSLALVSAVTKGYGDTSDEAAQKVSDMAFMTVKLGQTSFPELASSMGRVVPIAAALNVSQDELFAGFATLTGVTGNAAEVSTQLASVLTAMAKPSEDMTNLVNKLGFESATTMVKEKGLAEALQMMSGAVDGNADKMAALLGRKEALVAALALTGGQADTFTEKLSQMADVAGATDEAFKEQTDGINKAGFQYEQAKARVFKMAVAVGDKLAPAILKVIEAAEPMIEAIANADDETIDMALNAVVLAAKIGLISTGIGKLLRFSSEIKTFMGAMTKGSGSLASEMGKAGEQADKLEGKLGKVHKAAGVLASFGVGYSIGEFIHHTWMEPAETGKQERETGIGNIVADMSMKMHNAARVSDEQLQSQKVQLRQYMDALPKTDLEAAFETPTALIETFASNFSDTIQRPIDAANQQFNEAAAIMAKIDTELAARKTGEVAPGAVPERPMKMDIGVKVSSTEGAKVDSVTTTTDNKFANLKTGKNTP